MVGSPTVSRDAGPARVRSAPQGPRELRIVAVIDGVDELLITPTEARWVRRLHGMPEHVSINGRAWDPDEATPWVVEEAEPFLAADVPCAAPPCLPGQGARFAHQGIEAVRGHPGDHDEPIELAWWLYGGAVGVRGSITMPLVGMSEDFDWFSFPWALAHETLHGFGYHHGPELDRIDREVIARFERMAWAAEFDADFVTPGW